MNSVRLYAADLSFYEEYMAKLIEEAREGFSPALERLSTCVPRLADRDVKDIPDAELTIEDARWVYAREHGFDDWDALAAFVAQVNAGDRNEPFVEFIHAVEEGNRDVVVQHLDRDPDLVNHIASTHKSPLHSAGDVEMAKLVMSRGAPVDLEVPLAGGTPLIHALIWGRTEKAEVIAKKSLAPGNLRVAAGLGRMDLLEKMWLSDGTLSPEARAGRAYYRPNYGWFPWMPGTDDQEVLDEALIYAATNNHIEAAQYLIHRGADVNGLAYETRPLHRAAWRGHTEMIDWLLDQGASVNATGWLGGHVKGGTALHLAANNGNLRLAKQLVDRGADLTVRDALYNGPPDGWAEHFNHTDVRDYLRPLREAQESNST